VPASAVDWERYSAGNLPYQLRQDPGPDNALGLVKIMFPNPYLVYLHDSPAKALYDEDERAFSSGCIRVQKPFELTELVLNDPERWNQTTMQAVIKTGKTETVNLQKPLPVLILYWTAQPTADGQIMFRSDVYGRDPPLLRALSSFKCHTACPAPRELRTDAAVSLSLFRARCSSPAPLSNISTPWSFRNGIWPNG
jgi:murein L,D-transpeptidase YcbB/YkuD